MNTFRVDVQDNNDIKGAYSSGDKLGETVLEAVRGSRTWTSQAFVIDLICSAVIEELFKADETLPLIEFLKGVHVPMNVRDSVKFALEFEEHA